MIKFIILTYLIDITKLKTKLCLKIMSNIKKFHDGDKRNIQTAASGDGNPVPQPLEEVLRLINSINRHLEDCAVEWQSCVSKEQWKILNVKSLIGTSWDQSLLARTYFIDKNLDEDFQKLLEDVRVFMKNMKNFIALLRDKRPIIILESKEDVQHQSSKILQSPVVVDKLPKKSNVTPLNLSLFKDNKLTHSGRRRSKRFAENLNSNIQYCFADLIKAKIDLDTKFLGFEAVLNNSIGTRASSSEEFSCLCQICSNVLDAVMDNEKILQGKSIPKIRRVTRVTSKKLSRSARMWKRNKDRKKSLSLARLSGNSLFSPKDTTHSQIQ